MADDLNWSEVQSSNVAKVAHDPQAQKLHVEFKDGGRYVYHGVDAAAHADLMAAKSVGSHLYKNVVSSYRGERFKEPEPE